MKLSRALLSLALVAGASLTIPPTAQAANPTCNVPSGMTYNIPDGTKDSGTKAQQFRWHNQLTCMINATPKGATITASAYSWGHDASADALIRADRRGVKVRLVMWKARQSNFTDRFAKELRRTPGSWFKLCHNACLGPNGKAVNVHHSKVWTFSQVNTPSGPVRWVSNMGTGNPVLSIGSVSWNVYRNIPNNRTFYDGLTAYVLRMRADKDQRYSAPKVIRSGATTLHLYPARKVVDRQLQLLNATSCKGGTTVRAAVYNWSNGRLGVAKRMAALKRGGCDVRVIINYDSNLLGDKVLATLLAARIPVRNAHSYGLHTHAKDLYIQGRISGRERSVVVSGSQNWTGKAITAGDENIYEVESAAVFGQHRVLWDRWARNAVPVTRPVSKAATPDSAPSEVYIPTTNDPNLIEE